MCQPGRELAAPGMAPSGVSPPMSRKSALPGGGDQRVLGPRLQKCSALGAPRRPKRWPPNAHMGAVWMLSALALSFLDFEVVAHAWGVLESESEVQDVHDPGGLPARLQARPRERYPYIVRLKGEVTDVTKCAGVLFTAEHVLTAAHCLDEVGPDLYVVVGGAHNDSDQVVRAEVLAYHPRWKSHRQHDFDFGLLRLPIAVRGSTPSLGAIPPGVASLVHAQNAASWVEVHVQETNADLLPMAVNDEDRRDGCSHMLCLNPDENQKLSKGDSGSPLLIPDAQNWDVELGDPKLDLVVGIVSFGSSCCGGAREEEERQQTGEYAGAHLRLDHVQDWIRDVSFKPFQSLGKQIHRENTRNVPDGRVQYMVSVRRPGARTHICSGVLVHSQWVLTAAHCVDNQSPYSAGRNPVVHISETNAGELGIDDALAVVAVKSVIHGEWDGKQGSPYNAALIKLPERCSLTLPRVAGDHFTLVPGQRLSAFGYGSTDLKLGSDIFGTLKTEEQLFIADTVCNGGGMWGGAKPEGLLCGLNGRQEASCVVDSGSPLMLLDAPGDEFARGIPSLDFLIGINVDGAPCGKRAKPDIYVDVQRIKSWIVEQTEGLETCSHLFPGPAPKGRLPYLASIRPLGSDSAVCSGVLVKDEWVLTAAHCINAAQLTVTLGRYAGDQIAVQICEMHPNWTGTPDDGSDIALLKLSARAAAKVPMLPSQASYSPCTTSMAAGFRRDGSMVPVDVLPNGTISLHGLHPDSGSPILLLDSSGRGIQGQGQGYPLNDILIGIVSAQDCTLFAGGVSDWVHKKTAAQTLQRPNHSTAIGLGVLSFGFAVTGDNIRLAHQYGLAVSVAAGLTWSIWYQGTQLPVVDRVAISLSLLGIVMKLFISTSRYLRGSRKTQSTRSPYVQKPAPWSKERDMLMCNDKDLVGCAFLNLPHVRYHTRMLSFLGEQLRKVDFGYPVSDKLQATLTAGEQLIKRHAAPFDVAIFYRTAHTRDIVERICGTLRDSVESITTDVRSQIETRVPELDFEEDRKLLGARLRFVISSAESHDPDAQHADEWQEARGKHMAQMRNVRIVFDDEAKLQDSVCIRRSAECCVYRGMWRGAPVAIKRINRLGNCQDPEIELKAQLFAEAGLAASLLHDNIVRVLALTRPGDMVITELALQHLVEWHSSHKNVSWQVTVNLLHQASRGLALVHSLGDSFAHGNICTSSFLVFEDDSGSQGLRVKLNDFGIVMRNDSEHRFEPGMHYRAPELCEQMPRSQPSDVFSFGVVMQECAAARTCHVSHGRVGDVDIVSKRRKGELLYQIPVDCPRELEDLMAQCTLPDPLGRPSMHAVQKRLGTL